MWLSVILSIIVLVIIGAVYVLPIIKVMNARPLKIYQTIHAMPLIGKTALGDWYLSKLIGFTAPYTSSIGPIIEHMDEDSTRISITERRSMTNPFNSIHAAALVNLGDLVCGIQVTNQTIPRKLRAIPVEIKAEYPKKSRGKIVAKCDTKVPAIEQMEIVNGRPCIRAVADLTDEAGDLCCKITMLWSCSTVENKKKD